jgi:hypothetical protein
MTRLNAYGRLGRAIAAADARTFRERWEYGRRLACDPVMTGPDENLRPGAIADLIVQGRQAGKKLDEAEIEARLEAARAYPCESQARKARERFESWAALLEAGFPVIEAEAGEKPFDPRGAIEKARAIERQLAFGDPDDPGQLELFAWFPEERFDELSTLAELAKYAAEMREWTERHAARDRDRADYLQSLADAVGGNMSATWQEAQAALDAE